MDLSENKRFAEAVGAAGLVFIGPTPEAIGIMGDKAAARAAAKAAGVPITPGRQGEVGELEDALAAARSIGFAVMLKASVVMVAAEFASRLTRRRLNISFILHKRKLSRRSVAARFISNGSCAVPATSRCRYWATANTSYTASSANARYSGGVRNSGRRRPRRAIDDVTRQVLRELAVRLAERVSYRGAGTLEYLYDDETGEFFFIEMNTRIQVEHPITEMITGIDLVREMIRIAQGEPLRLAQADVHMRAAAIEVRINAEDPDRNFRPAPGRIATVTWPAGPGVRVDTMLFPGYAIPPTMTFFLPRLLSTRKLVTLLWRGCAARSTSSNSMVWLPRPSCMNVLLDCPRCRRPSSIRYSWSDG